MRKGIIRTSFIKGENFDWSGSFHCSEPGSHDEGPANEKQKDKNQRVNKNETTMK